MNRKDTRTVREKIADENWKIPIKTSELKNQAELDAISEKLARDKWEAEYFNPATSLLRKEQMRLQREQDQFLDAREREQQVKDHVNSPRIAKKLQEAKAIRAAIEADPERLVSDLIAADKVIRIFELPEADHAVGDSMLTQLREFENSYRLGKAAEFRKQADEAERKFRQVMGGVIETKTPQRLRVEGHDSYERIDDLAAKAADDSSYSLEDLEEIQKARRAAVLTGDKTLAEEMLARFTDTSPVIDQSGLGVTDSE